MAKSLEQAPIPGRASFAPYEIEHDLTPGVLFDALMHSVAGLIWLGRNQDIVDCTNEAWVKYTGLSMAESVGKGWFKALHPADASKVQRMTASRAPLDEAQIRIRRADGGYRWHLVRTSLVAKTSGWWIGCAIDIHEQVVAQQKNEAQITVLSMVASDAPVPAVLEALCQLGEAQLPGCRCSVLMLDEGETQFESGAAAFLPEHVRALLPGTKIGPGVGSCGTAAFERRDVISVNILTDPLWAAWRHLFVPLGVVACWSRPVYGADGKVLATYGFYFFEERVPTEEELENLDNLRHLASVAIEKARIAQALRESEEHHRHTVEHNPQIPWTADAMGRVLSVSSRWTEETGLCVGSAMGHGWLKALHPDDVKATVSSWSINLRTGEDSDLKYRIRLRDGTYRWVRARASPRRDARGNIIRWYGAVEDIHELELATERLRRQVCLDDLTRLLNRRGLVEQLRMRLATASHNGSPLTLLNVNIVGFRQVNDRFGHDTGDATLRLFGKYLHDVLEGEAIVARLAGDEFAVVLSPSVRKTQLQKHVEKIATELNKRLARNAKTRHCSSSIGCAVSEPNSKAEELLRRANLALYAAKKDCHEQVKVFTPALRRTRDERIEQIELARSALRCKWLRPYYQPIVSLSTGKVAGAEALLRIAHPTSGILSPAAIWAALDAPKVSKAIDDRMLSLVFADIARWGAWPSELGSISVNLSTEALLQDGLSKSILRKIKRQDISPVQVTVEITERVLLDNIGVGTHKALSELRRHGVRVSLDDFGTGFASLTHLQTLPVNEFKIDRSFVNNLEANGPNAAIVKSMISLGSNMGVDVVAEGVELAGQAQLLRDWGCAFAQGFYFYRPMSAQEFGGLLEREGQSCCEKGTSTSAGKQLVAEKSY